jgi:hypothetical protein
MTEGKSKENFMKGKGWLVVIIALFAGYNIYIGLRELIKSRKEKEQWTAFDRDLLINKCFNESGNNGLKYPELTTVYCECSHDKIMKHFTKSEYLEIIKKPTADQIKISLPIFQDCLTEYQNAMKQANE